MSCPHNRVESWTYSNEPDVKRTCLTCFEILSIKPNGLCSHRFTKKAIEKASSAHPERALCMMCGCVIEHSIEEKSWKEVVFNGWVINEQYDPAQDLG